MAEPGMNLDQENELPINNNNGALEKDQEPDHEEEINADHLETNSSLLSGLNLVLVLSFLSLSSEDSSFEIGTAREMQNGDYKAKHGTCSETRRRETHQFPVLGRQTPKVHTKIRDVRHCRRL